MFHTPGGDWNPGRGDNPIYDATYLKMFPWNNLIWVFPKIGVFPPKSSILIGFSTIFTIHFGGPPLFLETSICTSLHIFSTFSQDALKPENLQKVISTILYLFIAALAPAITQLVSPNFFGGFALNRFDHPQ